jgi:hypothetical protein
VIEELLQLVLFVGVQVNETHSERVLAVSAGTRPAHPAFALDGVGQTRELHSNNHTLTDTHRAHRAEARTFRAEIQ